MAGHFRSSVWDPVLIVSQILTMQSLFYLCLGVWIFLVDFICGSPRSLDQLFSYKVLQVKEFQGRLIIVAYVLNALTGATGLWYIVKRTKQCLDFAATVHLCHFVACWIFNGLLPSLSWWLINIISLIITTVLGEFLCMRTELKAIPLSMGPRTDL